MSEEILASTNCPYCIGYTDGSGFHHGLNCPTLEKSSFSFTVNPINKSDEIINLLKDIGWKLERIHNEIVTIRLRTR